MTVTESLAIEAARDAVEHNSTGSPSRPDLHVFQLCLAADLRSRESDEVIIEIVSDALIRSAREMEDQCGVIPISIDFRGSHEEKIFDEASGDRIANLECMLFGLNYPSGVADLSKSP